jgi:hypothetical protein
MEQGLDLLIILKNGSIASAFVFRGYKKTFFYQIIQQFFTLEATFRTTSHYIYKTEEGGNQKQGHVS